MNELKQELANSTIDRYSITAGIWNIENLLY